MSYTRIASPMSAGFPEGGFAPGSGHCFEGILCAQTLFSPILSCSTDDRSCHLAVFCRSGGDDSGNSATGEAERG